MKIFTYLVYHSCSWYTQNDTTYQLCFLHTCLYGYIEKTSIIQWFKRMFVYEGFWGMFSIGNVKNYNRKRHTHFLGDD